jgi:6-phosphogluconolactonase
MAIKEHLLGNPSDLNESLYAWSVNLLQPADGKEVSLLLSGGTTPLPFYRKLAGAPLPWYKMRVGLVDERWVSLDHELSNELAIRMAFTKNTHARRTFMGMKTSARTAELGVADCNARYAQFPWPATLAILGMGSDGHTASWFPNSKGLQEALFEKRYCTAINAEANLITGPCTERMTLTLWALLQCERIALVITGDTKRQVYEKARAVPDPKVPVSLLLALAAKVDVFWCP